MTITHDCDPNPWAEPSKTFEGDFTYVIQNDDEDSEVGGSPS